MWLICTEPKHTYKLLSVKPTYNPIREFFWIQILAILCAIYIKIDIINNKPYQACDKIDLIYSKLANRVPLIFLILLLVLFIITSYALPPIMLYAMAYISTVLFTTSLYEDLHTHFALTLIISMLSHLLVLYQP